MNYHATAAPHAPVLPTIDIGNPADLRRMRRARARLESYVQELIAFLDTLDGDPDLEPDADAEAADDTLETCTLDEHGELDDSDKEPSLGSTHNDYQGLWASGSCSDREDDAGDRGEVESEDGNGEFKGGCRFGADAPHVPYDGGACAWL